MASVRFTDLVALQEQLRREIPQDTLKVARSGDDKLVRRPLSPHLQVYRWPVSMVLSIGHRVAGVELSVGALLMTWWLVAASISEAAFEPVQHFMV